MSIHVYRCIYIWLYRNEQINSYLLNAFAKLILQWGKKERHKAKYEIMQISGLKKKTLTWPWWANTCLYGCAYVCICVCALWYVKSLSVLISVCGKVGVVWNKLLLIPKGSEILQQIYKDKAILSLWIMGRSCAVSHFTLLLWLKCDHDSLTTVL